MSQMLKSSGAMAAATMLSRVLGLVREIAYAGFMGDSAVASAFKFAFVVPNLFRRLLGEGALTAAFIPIFKEKEKTAGEAEMWRAANAVISAVVIVSAGIIALVLLGVSLVLAWGALEANTRLMLELLRVMLPYLLLVCLAAIFMGMLNARGYFFIPALGATMLNVVMIASVYLAAPRFGATKETQIFALACGVVVAGIAQAVFQLPSLHREGFRLAWVRPWPDDTVRQVVRKMIPAALGVAAYQINIMITFALGFRVDETVVASFDYAVRLMELPQGVFGVSLATYLLPTLSGLAVERKYPEFRATLARGVSYLAFVNALAAALLVALAEPMIRLLFERGAFDVLSTKRATLALQCLAPGLLGFSLVNVLARAFFALGDTQTPMRISVFCLGFNVLLAFLFVEPLRQGGLALANTLSSVVNVLLLLHALRRKLGRLEFADVRKHLPLLFACAVLAGWIGWGLARWWSAAWGHATLPLRCGEVFVPMALAVAAYLALTHACRIHHAREFVHLILGRLKSRNPAAGGEDPGSRTD